MRESTVARMCLSLTTLICGLLFTQTSSAAAVSPLSPVTEADRSMGLCYAFYDDEWMQLANNAGARWDRFDFRWDAIETWEGNYDFGPHMSILNRYDNLHIDMDVVGILGSPPSWAIETCGSSAQRTNPPISNAYIQGNTIEWSVCIPKGLYEPWDSPNNRWGRYVETVVRAFAGKVDTWEMWNEPDLPSFWAGSARDYAQLLKVGYLSAKYANPNATVLFGGLAYWGNPDFYKQVLDALAADPDALNHGYYFDVMSLHLYSNVYQAHSISAKVMAEMNARVGAHPLWLTETGVPIWDEDFPSAPYYHATASEAAAYVIEAYANARAAGVEHFFVFRLHDDFSGMGGRFGITRDDHSIRPAYVAYQVAARYLRDAHEIVGPFAGNIYRISFLSNTQGRTDVVWNSSPTPRTLEQAAFSPSVTHITHEGLVTTLTTTSTYAIPLAPATANANPEEIYMIGGPPVLLAYGDLGDRQAPSTTLNPLPTHMVPGSVSLTWEVMDPQTGYWYAELQAARSPAGPWTDLAGVMQTVGRSRFDASSITSDGPWYFRARARDQAGNWESWPSGAQVSTTIYSTRLVTATISAFTDPNGNGIQDDGESDLQDATFIWQAANGSEVDRGSGGLWETAHQLPFGDYRILILHPEHLTSQLAFTVAPEFPPMTVQRHQGLLIIRGQMYLPLVLNNRQ